MFDSKNKTVPCVGMSLGIERIFSVLENRMVSKGLKTRTTEVDVYVASAQKNLHEDRIRIVQELWEAGIKTEQSYKKSPKILVQLQHCEEYDIPLAVIIGQDELKKGVVTLRNVKTRKETTVLRDELVKEIRRQIESLSNN